MGKYLIRGFLLGGAVAFIWMMVSWMVLPWHCAVMSQFTDESAVTQVIMENAPESGIYMLPTMCDLEVDVDTQVSQMKEGPMIFAAVQRKGFDYESLYPFVVALVTAWAGAFFITYLMLLAKDLTYWGRVWFVTLSGLTVGILGSIPNWNWMGFSFEFVALEILDLVIAWWLAGLVIAAVTRRKTA